MKDIKFNWCVPREYIDGGEKKYAICRGGEKMDVGTLAEMQGAADDTKPKTAQPWGQAFTNGYRVTTETLNYADWDGITFADVDSKWFYKLVKPFNVDKLLKGLYMYGPTFFEDNFYAVHLTNSKQGYRIFWYWECERTEENFKKCCVLTERYTRELFYMLGDQAKQIIDFNENGHRVLDRCSNSIMQGFYVTVNPVYIYNNVNSDTFGQVNLDDISLEQIYAANDIIKTLGDFEQKDVVKVIGKQEARKEDIRYAPHQHRRCIYEALVVLLNDREKVDEEWAYVCSMLPEGNGHDMKFYINEPSKCRWFERFNKNIIHKLDWLQPFGYQYVDETEYIYWKQFRDSWKKHVRKKLIDHYIEKKTREWNETNKGDRFEKLNKDMQERLVNEWKKDIDIYDIYDESWDKVMTEDDDKMTLEEWRNVYWKTRWGSRDFKWLCDGYEITKDIVTYKMYADFYYRDDNNKPTISYDIMEDQINVIGYWPETDKIQWHVLKYNDEYTHWKNNDTFSNKAVKQDLTYAINKYVPRWHGSHTIKDYLNSLDLKLADTDKLETWAIRYFKADDNQLVRTICKNFFIAAVKKIMIEDPTKFVFQHMLFLHGETGCGKTAFLTIMFTINGKSFILNKIDPNGKDNEIGPLIAKNWLIQFGESESLKKVSVNAAKEFMDRINLGMKYQKKYENEQTTIYPRILGCRTSNDDVLFNDASVDIDRRNWLIECKTPMNSCGTELINLMEKEKDVLWATALKLYLDDPNSSLELPGELFEALGEIQEKHKLITNDDIIEIYDEIFSRDYMTNYKGEIIDEQGFLEQIRRSDETLDRRLITTSLETQMLGLAQQEGLQPEGYNYRKRIDRIPVSWIKRWVTSTHGTYSYGLFRKYLLKNGWDCKQAGWHNSTCKCYIKIKKKNS